VIIWDWHKDEYDRVNFFCPGERYVGENTPDLSQVIASPEHRNMWQLNPAKTILYPCVDDTKQFTDFGFKYAFTKDSTQQWEGESLILPPVFEPQPPQEKTNDAVCIIHEYKIRQPENYRITKSLGVPIYGHPENHCHNVPELLAKTKFLVHFKHIGYLCNAVLKAMMNGTIPIFDKKAFTLGYSDYLTPDVSCIVINEPNEVKTILTMSDATREDYIKAINESMAKVIATYPEVKQKAKEFVNGVD
jgi:hypothetical protein